VTNLQKTLTGARKPRGIAGAPVPKRMKAAQGGIVGFQSGNQVEGIVEKLKSIILQSSNPQEKLQEMFTTFKEAEAADENVSELLEAVGIIQQSPKFIEDATRSSLIGTMPPQPKEHISSNVLGTKLEDQRLMYDRLKNMSPAEQIKSEAVMASFMDKEGLSPIESLMKFTGAPSYAVGTPEIRELMNLGKFNQGGIVGFQSGALVPYGFNFGNQLIPSSNIVGTNPYAPRKEKFVPLQIDPSFTPKTDISPRTFPTIPAMTETKPVVPTFMPKGGPGTFPVPKNITKKETVEDTPKTPTPQGIKSLQYQPKDNLAAVLRAFQGGNPAAVQSLLAERDRQTKLGVDQFNIETQLAEAKIANTAEANQIDRELKEAIERGEARNALYGRLNRANESVLKAKQTFDNSVVGITINNKIAEANEKFRQNPTESRERVLQGLLTEKQQLLSQSGIDILEDTVNRINNSIQALDFDPNRSTVVTP